MFPIDPVFQQVIKYLNKQTNKLFPYAQKPIHKRIFRKHFKFF